MPIAFDALALISVSNLDRGPKNVATYKLRLFMVKHLPNRLLITSLVVLFGLSLQAQNYEMDGTPITDCQGYFSDSGGSSGTYGPNEDFTTTICSDGTEGTHVQLLFSGLDLGEGDAIAFYDSDTADPATEFELVLNATNQPFIIQATAANNSGCVTIVFTSDDTDEGNGWSGEINCTTACQLITADLVASNPAVMPIDTGWIDICPGDRVAFNGAGIYPQNGLVYNHSDLTSSFEWDFGDGNTAVGPNVTNVFDEPGGYIVQLTITDQFGCRNTNFLSQRVRVSTYPEYQLGGVVDQICVGDTINLNAQVDSLVNSATVSVQPVEGGFFQEGIRSDTLLLPDGTGGVYESNVAFNQFPPGATLTNPNDIIGVSLDLEHSYGGDLDIELICPDGTSVFILEYPSGVGSTNFGEPWATGGVDGGGSSDITPGEPYTYTFVNAGPGLQTLPQAAGDFNYTYTTVPSQEDGETHTYTDSYFPEGEYLPEQSFANLVGCPLNGEWTIRITDNLGLDNGWLFEWSIAFNPLLFAVLESFTPTFVNWGWENNPTIFYADQDSIAASPTNAGVGSYTFWVEDDFGCVNDTTVNINILPSSHPDCFNCDQTYNQQEDVLICENEAAALDVTSTEGGTEPVTFETFPVYAFGAGNHPPSNPYESTINVNSIVPIILDDPLTQIASVCVDIETDWDADINIVLETPFGLQFELSTGNGGAGDNYTGTCFTPTAATPIQAGTPPFTGNFQPEGNWSLLTGTMINGDWTLRVSDAFGINQMGLLNSWSITFNNINEVTYAWSPTTGLSCSNCPTPTANPTSSTTYEVEISNSFGCTVMDTVVVGVVEDIAAPDVSCEQVGAGIVFNWPALPGFVSYEINYIINGVETGWQGPYNDTEYTTPDLSNGDEVTLLVRAFFNSPADCPIPEGSCSLTYTTCDPQEIIVEGTSSTPVTCFAGADGSATVEVSGVNGPFTYQWDDENEQISATAVFLEAGAYTVVVTDAGGCQRSAQVTVGEPEELTVDFTVTDVFCSGGSDGEAIALPEGGIEPYSYAWNSGAETQTAAGLSVGTAEVSVTDANGCTTIASVEVNGPDNPVTALASQSVQGCFEQSGNEALVEPAGGTGAGYTFLWSDADAQSTAAAINLPAGEYTVTVTDGNGCSAVDTVELTDLPEITFNFLAEPPTCSGSTDGGVGLNQITGGAGMSESDYSFNWSTGDNSIAVPNVPGGVTYSVTVTDQQGCEAVQERFLPDPEPVTFTVETEDASCFEGGDGTASVTNLEGPNGGYTYQWSAGTGSQNTSAATNLMAGNYSVTVTDELGCFAVNSGTVGSPEGIEVNLTVANNECYGQARGSIAVSTSGGTPGYDYRWSNNDTVPELTALFAGDYSLTITDANGCERELVATVKQPEAITMTADAADVSCFGGRDGSISLDVEGGTPPFRFSLDNQTYLGTSTLIGLRAGAYTVFVRDANGCQYQLQTEVVEPPEFTVDAGPDLSINFGDSIQLQAIANNPQGEPEFIWFAPYEGTLSCNECPTPFASPEYTIDYELYGIDENGCEDTDLLRVSIRKNKVVLVPTGFTPNGDNTNDLLRVHGLPGTRITTFRVYDRWGELVYEAADAFEVNDPDIGWDGTFRGRLLNSGVFIWSVTALHTDGEESSYSGQTTLIR